MAPGNEGYGVRKRFRELPKCTENRERERLEAGLSPRPPCLHPPGVRLRFRERRRIVNESSAGAVSGAGAAIGHGARLRVQCAAEQRHPLRCSPRARLATSGRVIAWRPNP